MPRVRREKNLAFGEHNVNDVGYKKNFFHTRQSNGKSKEKLSSTMFMAKMRKFSACK